MPVRITQKIGLGRTAAVISAGDAIAGGEAVALNVDTTATRLEVLAALKGVVGEIVTMGWPLASGGGGDPDPDVPANTALPSILTSPIELGKTVSLDGGAWDGAWDSIEVRLQQGSTLASPGTIWLDWTSAPAGIAGAAVAGGACYIAARAVVGGVPGTPVINPTNFGPWVAFAEAFVGRYDFRGALADATSQEDVFVVCPAAETGSVAPSGSPSGMAAFDTMAAVSGDGTNWADCGGSCTPDSRGSETGRLRGRVSFSSAATYFAIKVPNGRYRARLAAGDTTGSFSNVRISMRNGTADNAQPVITDANGNPFEHTGGHASGNLVCISESGGNVAFVEASKTDIKTWMNGDESVGLWSAPFEITNGGIRLQRQNIGGAGGGGYYCFLDIKTAEAA